MKLYIVIFLLGSIALATSLECRLTECEGNGWDFDELCKVYKYERYTGKFNDIGCKWFTSRRECCKVTPGQCEWTTSCYGPGWNGDEACTNEYSSTYKPSGKSNKCNTGIGQTQFECCPPKPELEDAKTDAETILE